MEIKDKLPWREWIQKIGVVRLLLIIGAGVVLLVFSFPEETGTKTENTKENTGEEQQEIALAAMEKYANTQERATEKILSQVEGIGQVQVMVTLAASQEKIILQNGDVKEEDTEEKDKAGGKRTQSDYESKEETILVQKEGEETPYVVQLNSPEIEGVVVVAQGADSGAIKAEIIEAIQALFPIEAHKIKVMKMEQ